ncbi:hypothetical protein GALMADRAFT_220114 [Galerina marginata CBS 339.88]|uniref:Uncharacterized protein n=1 Tax=Galerina marginata (strain CBS 339.88) TaxID=685588 RepID=A0A067TME2_GALM3|nr:hypothetical protein GALMADRAFT_220114 [Galerina marginata CBS 339.88]
MKLEGKSVVLLELVSEDESVVPLPAKPDPPFSLAALFAVADPLRAEAPWVITQLHSQGIENWISGDNQATATAVAKLVGIPSIAGVLPQQKRSSDSDGSIEPFREFKLLTRWVAVEHAAYHGEKGHSKKQTATAEGFTAKLNKTRKRQTTTS